MRLEKNISILKDLRSFKFECKNWCFLLIFNYQHWVYAMLQLYENTIIQHLVTKKSGELSKILLKIHSDLCTAIRLHAC